MLFSRLKKEVLTVTGMSCGHCEQAVVKGVQDLPGVEKAKADHGKNRVEIFYKETAPDMDAVRQRIVDLGYEVVQG